VKSHHSDGLVLHANVAVALREFVGHFGGGGDNILPQYDGFALGIKVSDGPRAGLSADVCGGSGGGSAAG